MRVAAGVEALELKMELFGLHAQIFPTLVWDQSDVVLIDGGLPTSAEDIENAMATVGVGLERLTTVLITHQDLDHIGGLPALLNRVGHPVEVRSHAAERPYIQGDLPFLRTKQDPAEAQRRMTLAGLTDEQREQAAAAATASVQFPGVHVDRTVADGEVLPACGGISVIHTPGHTPGHLCFYLQASKVLVAGDELDNIDGELFGPKPGLSADEPQAYAQISRFTDYDIDTVVCYHGGVCQGDMNARIRELATLP